MSWQEIAALIADKIAGRDEEGVTAREDAEAFRDAIDQHKHGEEILTLLAEVLDAEW